MWLVHTDHVYSLSLALLIILLACRSRVLSSLQHRKVYPSQLTAFPPRCQPTVHRVWSAIDWPNPATRPEIIAEKAIPTLRSHRHYANRSLFNQLIVMFYSLLMHPANLWDRLYSSAHPGGLPVSVAACG